MIDPSIPASTGHLTSPFGMASSRLAWAPKSRPIKQEQAFLPKHFLTLPFTHAILNVLPSLLGTFCHFGSFVDARLALALRWLGFLCRTRTYMSAQLPRALATTQRTIPYLTASAPPGAPP